jgi:dTDP-4-dehydrorhamnose reductase
MRILLTGASGQLGNYLLRELRHHDLAVVAWSGSRADVRFGYAVQPVDLARPAAVETAFQAARPTLVIHTAALARVDACYRRPRRARHINTQGAALLAQLADRAGARLLHVSTDLVFDGERGNYREEDAPHPLSVYARTKAEAETAVLASPRAVVVRVGPLFGPSLAARPAFFSEQVAALRQGRPLPLFEDEWRSPLGLTVAARALLAVARSDVTGLLHLGGPERLSRLEMGHRLARFLGCDPSVIVPTTHAQMPAPEPRPHDTSLDSSRWRGLFPGQPWPTWEEALREMSPL